MNSIVASENINSLPIPIGDRVRQAVLYGLASLDECFLKELDNCDADKIDRLETEIEDLEHELTSNKRQIYNLEQEIDELKDEAKKNLEFQKNLDRYVKVVANEAYKATTKTKARLLDQLLEYLEAGMAWEE